jgi:hypothetical protein
MASRKEELSADRLCAASAAVLRAVKEITDERGQGAKSGRTPVAPYPPDLMGSTAQPACLSDFTKYEVIEATAFLIRMGFLQYPRHAA